MSAELGVGRPRGDNSTWQGGMERGRRARVHRRASSTRSSRRPGQRPQGWLGPALTETMNTTDLLAELGFDLHRSTGRNDDQPYPSTSVGPLISVPYAVEVNDIPAFVLHDHTGEEFAQSVIDQFDALYEEGAASLRVMGVGTAPVPRRPAVPRTSLRARAGAHRRARRRLARDERRDRRLVREGGRHDRGERGMRRVLERLLAYELSHAGWAFAEEVETRRGRRGAPPRALDVETRGAAMSLSTPIPLEAFDLSIEDPMAARFLPPAAYTSEEFFRFELQAIWERDWVCVGRLEEVASRAITSPSRSRTSRC